MLSLNVPVIIIWLHLEKSHQRMIWKSNEWLTSKSFIRAPEPQDADLWPHQQVVETWHRKYCNPKCAHPSTKQLTVYVWLYLAVKENSKSIKLSRLDGFASRREMALSKSGLQHALFGLAWDSVPKRKDTSRMADGKPRDQHLSPGSSCMPTAHSFPDNLTMEDRNVVYSTFLRSLGQWTGAQGEGWGHCTSTSPALVSCCPLPATSPSGGFLTLEFHQNWTRHRRPWLVLSPGQLCMLTILTGRQPEAAARTPHCRVCGRSRKCQKHPNLWSHGAHCGSSLSESATFEPQCPASTPSVLILNDN